jgi:hypothetical protein
MGGASPSQEPDQPQTEMLRGVGGQTLNGTPLNALDSVHYLDIPNQCAVCHVHREAYEGPTQPANSGHTFEPNMRGCEPCHPALIAELLVERAHREINIRLTAIARYLDPDSPLYVDPSTLDPDQLRSYHIARFNYDFVAADKSYGSHNPEYARALLSEAESFFGIIP